MQLNVNIRINDRPIEKPTANFTLSCLVAGGLKLLLFSSASIEPALGDAVVVSGKVGRREFK